MVLAFALRMSTDLRDDVRAAGRFSVVALPAIVVLVLSGTTQAWRQIGTWWALVHSTYGHVLVAKVLLVAAIVVVASASRDAVRRRILTEAEGRRDLQRGLWIEAGMALGVLALTSVLVVSPPGREVQAASSVPVAHTVRARASSSRLAYSIVVQPAVPGDNTIVVSPRALADGQFLPVQLSGSATTGDGRAQTITFTQLVDGRWVGTAQLAKGTTQVTLVANDGTTTDRSSTQLPLP